MKKNGLRKLTLNRETLRTLADEQATGVNGAAIDTSLQYSRCPSCGIACTVPRLSCTCEIE